ncbi:hypothetical protein DEO72_LG10g2491 [Vigna unguiculata]|uniref:Uncharacterized protein n=1 Tax=Vigna unguiculata TaxID=3917 RepID=A0A4D6ND63_VIGUN|nr:hypothetical protein DEO72_LG10g2491 [Vigna unguiculata]
MAQAQFSSFFFHRGAGLTLNFHHPVTSLKPIADARPLPAGTAAAVAGTVSRVQNCGRRFEQPPETFPSLIATLSRFLPLTLVHRPRQNQGRCCARHNHSPSRRLVTIVSVVNVISFSLNKRGASSSSTSIRPLSALTTVTASSSTLRCHSIFILPHFGYSAWLDLSIGRFWRRRVSIVACSDFDVGLC